MSGYVSEEVIKLNLLAMAHIGITSTIHVQPEFLLVFSQSNLPIKFYAACYLLIMSKFTEENSVLSYSNLSFLHKFYF